ncbi:MAG: AAA family ATPase [Candidatus Firestonebacteria bacterium]|nr:AAA family ATPase [Candidatus Firestonebacteria bacterium]
MIIGITGTLGAGKTTIVDYLMKKEFKHYSVRDYLIKIIEKRGMTVNRDSMVTVGNELRAKHTPSYIVEELYKEAKQKGGNCIIESIRTKGEVDALRGKDEFFLIAVDADKKTRYNRITARKSATDSITFETFVADEEREMTSNDPGKQNLKVCIDLADFKIYNSGSIDDLNKKVEDILCRIKK